MARTKQPAPAIRYGVLASWYSTYKESQITSMLHDIQGRVLATEDKSKAIEYRDNYRAMYEHDKRTSYKLVEIKVIE